MKILITGASGFLGSALTRRWATGRHELALLVRPGSSLRRLQGLSSCCQLLPCATDTEAAAVARDFAPEAVAHTAACYGRQGETPAQMLDANVRLGLVLLQALAGMAVDTDVTFVNAGSALHPAVSPYALSKAQFVQWGMLLAEQEPQGLRFVDARLQHFYGPGDDASKFTTQVLHACHENVPRLDLTAGEQRRDFIHIDDVVEAFDTLVCQAWRLPRTMTVDVGTGEAPTVREFVELVHTLCRSRTRLEFGARPYRPGEPMLCRADTSVLRGLGWTPRYDLRRGLRQTLDLEFGS